ncbi:hypothetical protein [Dyella tabacisoli]|uniref:Uncharacterized protein n=1 Tax=Dyella tabacisoli TaxID=2282381 RepID=A0A369UH99_9GAMM|nr:hypothetical protein [Dyella tabacisoli]RDD80132.1 hypothetical protein DVJ77_18485 [Dyella tabacisoli]
MTAWILAGAAAPEVSEDASYELLREIKIRARLRLKDLLNEMPDAIFYTRWVSRKRRWPWPATWKLTHALNIVCTEVGFQDWEHARRVLNGHARPGDDMGGLWYDLRCQLLLNHWFASYEEARAFCGSETTRFLFPFAKQVVVGDESFIRMLGLDPASPLWQQTGRDLYASYGTPAWRALCHARLVATRDRLPIGRTPTVRNF